MLPLGLVDWTVWRSGKPQPIPSPTGQAQRQCRAHELWLQRNGISWIRQVNPVVLISPSSSVDRRKLPRDAHVVKSDNFAAWWKEQADSIGVGTALQMLGRHAVSGMSQADFETLGQRLVSSHVPATFDWRAKLGLPSSTDGANGTRPKPRSVEAPKREDADAPTVDVPGVITTRHGEIRIARIPDGRFALRNDNNDMLIELVRAACKGRARWNPRFRNWLVSGENLPEVLSALKLSQEDGTEGSS
jgi:hypothetical protein